MKGQARYVTHKQVNNAFMLHASTSPFYPLFASIDINAKMHSGVSGRRIWAECVKIGIEARKQLKRTCRYIQPFVPPVVIGRPWESYPTEEIARDLRFFKFEPGAKWHAFEGYGSNQYFVDPCKFLLTTPGIDTETGEYEDFGVPATILANYLRAHGVVPEKCDLNSILFLLTPSQTTAKISSLTTQIARFERLLDANAPMKEVIPQVYRDWEERYEGYRIRELCQEMHDFSREFNIKDLQKAMFRREHFPKAVMSAQQANFEFMRGNAEYRRHLAGAVGGLTAALDALAAVCTDKIDQKHIRSNLLGHPDAVQGKCDLHLLFLLQPYPTEEQVKEYLAGNLCRCSGYEGQLRGIMSFLAWKKQKEGVQ